MAETKTDTGGSAYPEGVLEYSGPDTDLPPDERGMTLLDRFAGQYLAGLITNAPVLNTRMVPVVIAKECYDQAAAMIARKRELEADDGPDSDS